MPCLRLRRLSRGIASLVAALGVLLLLACDDDIVEANVPASPTATATSTSTPAPTTTPTASPSATPATTEHAAAGIRLVDVATGVAHTLHAGNDPAWSRGFEDDGRVSIFVTGENRTYRYCVDGNLVEELDGFALPEVGGCTATDDREAAIIDGTRYPVPCGWVSPDETHMLYHIDIDPPSTVAGRYEAWLIDLATGEQTMLTDALRHCGGCDGVSSPAWSPSGRYVLFGETLEAEDSTAYLADAESGAVRVIARERRINSLFAHPRWSPTEDAYIVVDPDGRTHLERLPSGETVAVDLQWPAHFDGTGAHVYSWAGTGTPGRPGGRVTNVASAGTGEVIASWPGVPVDSSALDEGLAALLFETNECPDGVSLHHPEVAGGSRCFEDASVAAWVLGWGSVAYLRAPTPADDADWRDPRPWDLVLHEVSTGDERVPTSFEASGRPPVIYRNDAGTHLLVQWPGPDGH